MPYSRSVTHLFVRVGSRQILAVQPRMTSAAGGKSPDEIVADVAELLQSKLPTALLDLDEAKEGTFDKDANGQVKSLSTVLKQEVERFNKLIKVLWRVLVDIKKAIKGLVVMSLELEMVYTAFINNTVPPVWTAASYPSLRPLGSWITDLVMRWAFCESWLKHGAPTSFWLSGLYFPQGFLTGTLQTHARAYNLPIDTLEFKFRVTDAEVDPAECDKPVATEAPKDGVLVHGVFMEGTARNGHSAMHLASVPHAVNHCGIYLLKCRHKWGLLTLDLHLTAPMYVLYGGCAKPWAAFIPCLCLKYQSVHRTIAVTNLGTLQLMT